MTEWITTYQILSPLIQQHKQFSFRSFGKFKFVNTS
jgi:hypothetical protein